MDITTLHPVMDPPWLPSEGTTKFWQLDFTPIFILYLIHFLTRGKCSEVLPSLHTGARSGAQWPALTSLEGHSTRGQWDTRHQFLPDWCNLCYLAAAHGHFRASKQGCAMSPKCVLGRLSHLSTPKSSLTWSILYPLSTWSYSRNDCFQPDLIRGMSAGQGMETGWIFLDTLSFFDWLLCSSPHPSPIPLAKAMVSWFWVNSPVTSWCAGEYGWTVGGIDIVVS